jgi:hypothetical protein
MPGDAPPCCNSLITRVPALNLSPYVDLPHPLSDHTDPQPLTFGDTEARSSTMAKTARAEVGPPRGVATAAANPNKCCAPPASPFSVNPTSTTCVRWDYTVPHRTHEPHTEASVAGTVGATASSLPRPPVQYQLFDLLRPRLLIPHPGHRHRPGAASKQPVPEANGCPCSTLHGRGHAAVSVRYCPNGAPSPHQSAQGIASEGPSPLAGPSGRSGRLQPLLWPDAHVIRPGHAG